MEVLSGPWAGLTLFLRQAFSTTGTRETDSFLHVCLLGLLLFLTVCALLLLLIAYMSWKLGEVETQLARFHTDRSTYRQVYGTAAPRKKKSFGSQSPT